MQLKTFHIMTFGCQMNENDSEKIGGILTNIGYHKTDDAMHANVVVINTCSVRENADDRFFGNLGRYKAVKKKNPDMVLAVCGCMMQQSEIVERIKNTFPYVDIIFGTHNIHEFDQLISEHLDKKNQIDAICEDSENIPENVPVLREFKHKALITIMNGCNNFCSYCIVPYTRGREKSREKQAILREIETLAKDGCKEVMLLGQNVNSYGKTLKDPSTFAELLNDVNRIQGLERIRFMTSNPKDLSDELIEALAQNDKVCNHIHLPLQSGSNRILKLMNRKYTQESYLELIDKLYRKVPGIAVTTDIIVGFPDETEDDFLHTLHVMEQVEFDSAFTFIFSPRRGTKAAEMENGLSKECIHERFTRLSELQHKIMHEKSLAYQDKIVTIITDGLSKTDDTMKSGRTDTNKLVNFSGECEIGDTVKVKITQPLTFHLLGKIID